MEINHVTAMIAVVCAGLVMRGYTPLIWHELATWSRCVFIGVLVTMLAMVLRLLYWDFVQSLAGDDWITIRDALGGQRFSSVFNIIFIAGCIVLLQARFLLIPPADRKGWHWYNAWHHPSENCLQMSFFKRKDKK